MIVRSPRRVRAVAALLLALEATGSCRVTSVDAAGPRTAFGPSACFLAAPPDGAVEGSRRSGVQVGAPSVETQELDQIGARRRLEGAPAAGASRLPAAEPSAGQALRRIRPLSKDLSPVVPFHLDSKK